MTENGSSPEKHDPLPPNIRELILAAEKLDPAESLALAEEALILDNEALALAE